MEAKGQAMTPVRDTQDMIAGMTPVADAAIYRFCAVSDPELARRLGPKALASFAEDEGMSLVLDERHIPGQEVEVSPPMQRITLMVYSSLEGIGLTAAVAGALAQASIPCNMVAGYHHDHVFVPADDVDRALSVLRDLSDRAGTGTGR